MLEMMRINVNTFCNVSKIEAKGKKCVIQGVAHLTHSP
jgi:hypothetical protein